MSVRYKYSGLTKELHSRLVSEHAALKQAHPKDYKQFFQDVRQCSEVQARIIYQAFNSAVVERAKISPATRGAQKKKPLLSKASSTLSTQNVLL